MDAPPGKAWKRTTSGPESRLARWIAFPWIVLAPCAAAACGGEAAGPEQTSSTSSAIYAGVVDNDAQENGAVVALEVAGPAPDGGTQLTLCSGTLIAANMVLTARHCVSTALTPADQCDQNGNSPNGTGFGADLPAAGIKVFVGPGIYQNEQPAATAKAIFHPTGTALCNADVALLQLDTPVTTVAPMRVRLQSGVTANETVRAVGFGYNDSNPQQPALGTRYRKDGISILAVGSVVSASQTPLGSNEFELGESTCAGDSGGPAIDEKTGAVVGVFSRALQDCTLNYGHVFSSLEGFQAVFTAAFAAAGGNWYDENGPQPTVDAGAASSSSGASSGGSSGGTSSGGSSSGASSGGSTGGSSTGGGSGSSSGSHYGGGYNLQSGKGSACSAGAAGAGAETGVAWSAIALAGAGALAIAARRRRARVAARPALPSRA